MPRCSVVIPAYNASASIALVLDALTRQTIGIDAFECIVVDDGSTDDTAQLIHAYTDRLQLRYLHQENQGQGNARRNGFAHVTTDLIVLLQADTIAEPRTLEEHLRVHEKFPEEHIVCLGFTTWDPEVGITPLMYFMEHGGHQFAYEKAKKFPTHQGSSYPSLPYQFFYTSNLSLKKSLLEKETFDPSFTKYGWEDIELGYRLQTKQDMKLLYNAHASVLHHEFISEERWQQKMCSIGKNGIAFERMCPEVRVLPHGYKKWIFRVLASSLWRVPARIIMNIFPHRWTYFAYYYAQMKYLTFQGMREGERELAQA